MNKRLLPALLCAALNLAVMPSAFAADKKADAAKDDAVAEDIPGDPAKFFLFHKEGVSADQVRGDLVFCIGQARPILSMRDRMGGSGGLLGAIINARMAEIDRFRMRNAAMRKCMGMIGYDRYLVPEDMWKVVVDEGDIVLNDDALVDIDVVERMVAFASGPKPTGERLPQ
jgi:hypothetical protein